MKNIVVLGGGVLGSQIAFQSAYCGFNVTVWLRSEGSIGRTQPKLDTLRETYIDVINTMDTPEGKSPLIWAMGIADPETFDKEACLAKVEEAYKNVKLELDMAKAVEDADLVIESMAEDVEAKIAVYKELAPLMPEKTVLVTNSSSFLPSTFAEYTGRPEKYLALHFSNGIWKNNCAEVMVQSKTEECYFEQLIEFAKEIKMVPLPIKKEKAGYLLNSLLIPFLTAAMDLHINGIADVESIDASWKLGTGAFYGPFEFLDIVGLITPKNIVDAYDAHPEAVPVYDYKAIGDSFAEYIAQGKLGVATGEGFYKYDK